MSRIGADEIDYWRQLDLFDPKSFGTPVSVVGAGDIGSYMAWTLAKMGVRDITVYDSAKVSEDDLPFQMYGLPDVGRPRVEALRDLVLEAVGTEITPVAEDFSSGNVFMPEGVFFSAPEGTEEMSEAERRLEVWKAVEMQFAVPLLVDIRAGTPGGQVLAIEPMRPQHCDRYADTLDPKHMLAGRAPIPVGATLAGMAAFPLIETAKTVHGFRNLSRLRTVPLPSMKRLAGLSKQTPVTVIGAGATGSYVVWFLAKMGYENITVWDFDKVETHNLPNQLFGLGDVGRLKVDALRDRVFHATGIKINAIPEGYESGKPEGIFLTMVDSMKFRKQFWLETIKGREEVMLYAEPRMGIRHGIVYTVDPTDPEHARQYESDRVLYGDDQVEESACSNRSIAPSVLTLAGLTTFQAGGLDAVSSDRKIAARLNREGAAVNETVVNMSPFDLVAKPWQGSKPEAAGDAADGTD